MDTAQFREDFTEFSDETIYPDSLVQLWLTAALMFVDECRWGDAYNLGLELFTAHHLVVSAKDQQAAEIGAVPGQVTGATSSKSVDKVSVGFDTKAVTYEGAGFWNMSSYGIQFYQLMMIFGAGGIQL
ncbi:DUF4054 domain-containing protein [Silvimonas soli]|uniref:DUF4054 domain-containing protein n=1 Tax=Silvimonas soli TaxID=2980100 RepID=UPI0024B3BE7B|nr:DUF4054 domain-containing protein [Silvimonas soli]